MAGSCKSEKAFHLNLSGESESELVHNKAAKKEEKKRPEITIFFFFHFGCSAKHAGSSDCKENKGGSLSAAAARCVCVPHQSLVALLGDKGKHSHENQSVAVSASVRK